MNEAELSKLYEKYYFNEIDRREKIGARLNIPMGLLLAASSLLGYMINIAPHSEASNASVFFWISFDISCLFWTLAVWHFRGAWANRLSDKLMPTAHDIENYRREMLILYKDYENAETLTSLGLEIFLKNYYMEASSINAVLNDRRSIAISDTSIAITFCMTSGVVAYISLCIQLHF